MSANTLEVIQPGIAKCFSQYALVLVYRVYYSPTVFGLTPLGIIIYCRTMSKFRPEFQLFMYPVPYMPIPAQSGENCIMRILSGDADARGREIKQAPQCVSD